MCCINICSKVICVFFLCDSSFHPTLCCKTPGLSVLILLCMGNELGRLVVLMDVAAGTRNR